MAIKIGVSTKALSPLGGLHLFADLVKRTGLETATSPFLPSAQLASKNSPFGKFGALTLGLVAGADCLDDMADFAQDCAFSCTTGAVHSPQSYGDFLRAFSPADIHGLQYSLIDYALNLRLKIFPERKDFVLDIDSTSHRQFGKKMEGVEMNYKGDWCLDSLQCFDECGFQYWSEVRNGACFTSNGAAHALGNILRRVPRGLTRSVRADSGYCNTDVFNACLNSSAHFVIAMRENMFSSLIENVNRKAYALIASCAYNLLRCAAYIEHKGKLHFAKRLRRKMVFIACQVVKHAGQTTFYLCSQSYAEVKDWLKKIYITFGSGQLFSPSVPPRLLTTS